jgi:hypothetical protein
MDTYVDSAEERFSVIKLRNIGEKDQTATPFLVIVIELSLYRYALAVQKQEELTLLIIADDEPGKLVICRARKSSRKFTILHSCVRNIAVTDPERLGIKRLLTAVVEFQNELSPASFDQTHHYKGSVLHLDPTDLSAHSYTVPTVRGLFQHFVEFAIDGRVDDLRAVLKPPALFVDKELEVGGSVKQNLIAVV